jgi:hypothetical protein
MEKLLERRATSLLAGLVACAVPLASAGCRRYWICDEVDEELVARAPQRLSGTGLFADGAGESLAPGVMAYAPRFPLWSDGADKRRWLWLPPGTRIDTGDMDSWEFPVGSKFWKEFTRDGVRVETRLIEKLPGDEWLALAYLWRSDQSDADAAPFGAIDAGGTPHDVPASNECAACHGGRKSFVLGVSAIQLSSLPEGELDLAALVAADLVTTAPARSFEVPGSDSERAALGYLHANCSHCHNQDRPARSGARCFDPENELDFALSVDALGAPADTATYRSAVDSVVEPGEPGESRLIDLVSRRGFFKQMPPLASERVDDSAVSLLERWIREMSPP